METKRIEVETIKVSQDEMVNVYEFGDLYATYLNIAFVNVTELYVGLVTKEGRVEGVFDRRYYQVEIDKYVKLKWSAKIKCLTKN